MIRSPSLIPLSFLAAMAVLILSCAHPPAARTPEEVSAIAKEFDYRMPSLIMGQGAMNRNRLVAFFMANNPRADKHKVVRMAGLYIEEAALEGVNHDVAFSQMCVETGFLSFGGLVTEDMNNFCGLGSIGPGQPGLSFPDEQTGIRAHIQHLKAYGSDLPLAQPLADPRYRYVNPKGKSPTIQGLSGTWAADRDYGAKLERMLARLYSF